MTHISVIGTYQPRWVAASGRRVAGFDEDVTTLAVAAGRALLDGAETAAEKIRSVLLVSLEPDYLEGNSREVVRQSLGLGSTVSVEQLIGGGPTTMEALSSAPAGTMVIGVDSAEPAGSGAALVSDGSGTELSFVGRVARSVPIRMRKAGTPEVRVYDDPRMLRQRGWAPVIGELTAGSHPPVAVTGVPSGVSVRLGADPRLSGLDVEQAAAPLFALVKIIGTNQEGRVVAVLEGTGIAVDVRPQDTVVVSNREGPLRAPATWDPQIPGELPIAMPAYERAFSAKVGMIASLCTHCGALDYPPRSRCLSCGQMEEFDPYPLPRHGEIVSVVTVHTSVPGKPGPYSLAIVSLEDVDLRVLAHVTDAVPGQTRIADRGHLVLRRVAERAGVPDYGYAFQPQEVPA